ncbi:CaiB/BaiF CoA transferase family protein [Scopulibacillus daqui]|uniref:CaiB/BaiF CoA transferase family protein n=1 Tax=Scopulibacillus daqui TaxID=1469162 RepID=UPI00196219E3|nr:CaiB/BaiF CoA-transferase family protein [Scopulibacillus daqui]
MHGPLSGVRVVDLTRVLAGPYCTMILGDMGAEVIKIEAPGGNDDTRGWGPPYVKGESAYYLCTNRNKKAMTLNLKSEKGKDILKKIIKQSDILIHNFKTGTMEKWGLDYESLKYDHPELIYCHISGFGETGPLRHLAGYDFAIQAMSGLMSITGSEESGPMKVGVAITDVLTGLYANIGIQSALLEREKSGLGQAIDISLYDAAISSLVNAASNYLVSGKVPERLGNYHPNITPYQTFKVKDGEMVVAVGNDRQFQMFADCINAPELKEDPRFITNSDRMSHREELEALIHEKLMQDDTDKWIHLFREKGIPCAPIQNIDEVFNDRHVMAREMVIEMDHTNGEKISMVGSPLKMSRTKVSYELPPPMVGEHTDEILQQLGISEEECQVLKDQKII